MANTFIKIAGIEAGSGGVASFDFTSIPQTYTDLYFAISSRSSADNTNIRVTFNGSSATNYYSQELYNGNGTTGSGAVTTPLAYWNLSASNAGVSYTSNSFSNAKLYIPQYASSYNKQISSDNITSNNAGTLIANAILSGLWLQTAPITQVTFTPPSGTFLQYSSIYLYGIKNS